MKFAENNRISHRQLYRQMILTFLAPFLICLPGKNGIQGMTGIAGALAAVILLVIYVFVLLRVTSGYSDMVRFFWKVLGTDSRTLFSGVYYPDGSLYLEDTGADRAKVADPGSAGGLDLFSGSRYMQCGNRTRNPETGTDGRSFRRFAFGWNPFDDGTVPWTDTC